MQSKRNKRILKLCAKWSAAIAFVSIFFYLHFAFGKNARNTFSIFAGGLGMFIYGMNLMSESLQRIAGNRLKTIVSALTLNPLAGMLTGLGVTILVQSSSATTVMTVGFVNAGIMTLKQAIGIILGANIGTTVTAQLIAFKLSDLAWPILAMGSAMIIFCKSRKNRSWGETLFGFALLFLGMKFMGDTLKAYRDHETFKTIFITLSHYRFLGVFAGIFVTLIVQSSSATVGLTMSLISTGAFGEDPYTALLAAVPIILGDNIGTCITAMLASIGASRNARRAALAHTLFNTLGAILILPFLEIYCKFILSTSNDLMRQVANAHSIFNIGNGIIFLPLSGFLEKAAIFLVPIEEDEQQPESNLDKRLLTTPPIAIAQAETQLKQSIKILSKKFAAVNEFLQNKDDSLDEITNVASKLDNLHKQREQLYRDLNTFLISLAQKDLSEEMSRQVTRLLYLNKDLDIISSQLSKLVAILTEQAENNCKINSEAKEELHLCLKKNFEIFIQLTEVFSAPVKEFARLRQNIYSQSLVDQAARNNQIDRIKSGKHDPVQGITFLDALRSISSMLASMHHLCDHLENKF
jgi:phosphate:Na+ symporter